MLRSSGYSGDSHAGIVPDRTCYLERDRLGSGPWAVGSGQWAGQATSSAGSSSHPEPLPPRRDLIPDDMMTPGPPASPTPMPPPFSRYTPPFHPSGSGRHSMRTMDARHTPPPSPTTPPTRDILAPLAAAFTWPRGGIPSSLNDTNSLPRSSAGSTQYQPVSGPFATCVCDKGALERCLRQAH